MYIYKLLQQITFPIFIYIPSCGVIFTGIAIGIVVMHSRVANVKKSERAMRKEKNAVMQLFFIAACFLLGYVPWSGKFILQTI